jgi:multisubunit Na+/H+ antiporter MnhE subunit
VLRFVKYVILPIMLIMNVSLIPSIFICKLLSNTFVKVFISVIIIEILCFSSMYTIGLTKANRQVIKHKIASKIRGRA